MIVDEITSFFNRLRSPYDVSVKFDNQWLERPWDLAWPIKNISVDAEGTVDVLFDGSWDRWEDFLLSMENPTLKKHTGKYLIIDASRAVYNSAGSRKRESLNSTVMFVTAYAPLMPSELR
jgi:hypothetical protein